MYICTGCKSVCERMDILKHDGMCKGGTYMDYSAYLRHEEGRILKLEQQVASIMTDLRQASDLLRKYTK